MSSGPAPLAPQRPVRTWLALGLFVIVFFAARQVANGAANFRPVRWGAALLDKGTYFVAMTLVVSLVVAAARRVDRWRRGRSAIVSGWLALVLLSMPLFAAALTLVRALAQGFSPPDGGFTFAIARNLTTGSSTYLILAVIVVIGDWGFRSYDAFVRERVAAARLAQELEREQLAAVSRRLDPDFVLGVLASIRSRSARQPVAAEELLIELGDLLRRMLESDPEGRWPLREEVRFAAGYLRLALAERPGSPEVPLDFEAESTDDEEVPTFLLRPWLEAAVDLARRDVASRVIVSIQSRRADGRLELELGMHVAKGTRLAVESGDRAAAFEMMQDRLLARFGESVRAERVTEADSGFTVRLELPAAAEAEPGFSTSAGAPGEVVWKRP